MQWQFCASRMSTTENTPYGEVMLAVPSLILMTVPAATPSNSVCKWKDNDL